MAGKPYRSSLEPHLERIRAWRRGRWSWQAIADELRKEHALSVQRSAVQRYFARQSRLAKPAGFGPSAAAAAAPAGGKENRAKAPALEWPEESAEALFSSAPVDPFTMKLDAASTRPAPGEGR